MHRNQTGALKALQIILKRFSRKNLNLFSSIWRTLKQDIEKGMYFDSSIPQGYGVGSSGALSSCYL
jgi:mevalonate kinase